MTKPLSEPRAGRVVLEIRGITKRFGSVVANDHIDLTIRAGELHAILGENGAGKTTLMRILFGELQPDEGEIYLNGQRVHFRSPRDALRHGIGMVHQERKLIPAHTALENIILGHPKTGAILNLREAEREVSALCERYGFRIPLHAKVWQLSEGEKQIVEILKELYHGARILILDEPTSVLTPPEIVKLLESLTRLAKEDLAVIPFITHKLPVVLEYCDRVTILRRGRVVGEMETQQATERTLAAAMVGREVLLQLERVEVPLGEPVLAVRDLWVRDDRGLFAVQGLSFEVRAGEILGIAGVAGNGQEPLAEALAGLRAVERGTITLEGNDITRAPALDRWKRGLGYVPTERRTVGSIPTFSLVENVLLNYHFEPAFSRWGVLAMARARELTERILDEYSVVASGPDAPAKSLSGGNLQKVILGRVLSRRPRFLIACHPTHGLDVGAAEFVQRKILEAKRTGTAVLLISEDLDEILALSDRIAAIYEGQFTGVVPARDATKELIGELMAGLRRERV
ncbi:ABC transporter ATP-binding protein [Thermomicrobium sp. 4228-Ro]|uniref:ABC transporter ATP-binding protein n=1 Tax=Thermomicrobium sp. 4228-Ro TaxID=2993937 RepID=UPI002248F875|nr:ABC transporter ATP-binding protein [Thermomicrobium sp. 4228-Ro]MCX2727938.1 ABC transporter ATP-binding protein [Thermomicrobium sp. 4228-Ro]